MEGVLTGLVGEKCIIYLDDVLIIGRTYKEHLDNLREVFTRLTNAGLKLKPSKCKLVQREVEFPGYVVSCEGISTDPKKLAAVAEFPRPNDLHTLRGFLGLTSYYCRFVPSFSTVTQPLYKLNKKGCTFCVVKRVRRSISEIEATTDESSNTCIPKLQQRFSPRNTCIWSGVRGRAVPEPRRQDHPAHCLRKPNLTTSRKELRNIQARSTGGGMGSATFST